MKYIILIIHVLGILTYCKAQKNTNPQKVLRETSYAYGYSFASDLADNPNFSKDEKAAFQVLKGLKEGMQPDSTKLASIVAFLMNRVESKNTDSSTPVTAKHVAYKLGYNALGNLVSLLELKENDLHFPSIRKGYMDAACGKEPKLSAEKRSQLLTDFFEEKQALAEKKARLRYKKKAEQNLAAAKTFLHKNSQKEGVQVTASGLQYEVIKQGSGATPSVNSRVLVHYTGTFIDGTVFDSSMERGEPQEFGLANVIAGWQEGITKMSVGGQYRFFISPALAYGAKGANRIPPYTLLIFEVKLLKVLENLGAETTMSKFSYAYGYKVGASLARLDLTEQETNVEAFIQGFNKGFEADSAMINRVEEKIKARFASNISFATKTEAHQLAKDMGYITAAELVLSAQAKRYDFDYKILAQGYVAGLEKKVQAAYTKEEMNAIIEAYEAIKKRIP